MLTRIDYFIVDFPDHCHTVCRKTYNGSNNGLMRSPKSEQFMPRVVIDVALSTRSDITIIGQHPDQIGCNKYYSTNLQDAEVRETMDGI
mmetsp:Transcript_19767/g.28575  ORF Transcript_19767/g.28575 Transcript_19767/m.28575 type:complete len:89 (+) Transcript_19767:1530-1796(+)